jgi:ATP-dependent DNA helicase HFM1/MER3
MDRVLKGKSNIRLLAHLTGPECTTSGVAFHNASLSLEDRSTVERSYLDGDLSVICCTSTLAVGVNLPCHFVIIKGTTGYHNGVSAEMSDLDVLQMLGRAGRPQFGGTAVAVIMTRQENVKKWEKLVSGQEQLESW